MDNNNNLVVAIVLSVLILVGFQYFYVKPQQEAYRQQVLAEKAKKVPVAEEGGLLAQADMLRDRADVIAETKRVKIASDELQGSINLKGARLDDLELMQYRETVDATSPHVTLLSPTGSKPPHHAYYAEFGWLAADAAVAVPDSKTEWSSDGAKLSPDHSARLSWDNGHGLAFERTISLDKDFMFTVTDRVTNKGKDAVTLYPFGLVARRGDPAAMHKSVVIHEGGLGVLDGSLQEYKYAKLIEDKKKTNTSTGGWLGITDKYWLMAMVPPQTEKIAAQFAYNGPASPNADDGVFQADFRGDAVVVEAGKSAEHSTMLFAGAKRVRLLDSYADKFDIPHFDKAIDFGWFYFLTRPFLYLLDFMGGAFGSFGIAILVFTVLLKLLTLPLSLKSNHSMSRMKALQPEMQRLQEKYAEDKARLGQEMMALYAREKVSPMSGCVPMLIQIPIFFALYKVLYVSIELRQTPFYGWIKDMSLPDPTSVFTLFGAFNWDVPTALHIGAWPLMMGISMFLQQKLSPQPPDKTQARMFLFMPIFFTYLLAQMPAGLVIYWTWSNLLSIAQQWYIMRQDEKRKLKAA